MAKTIELRRHTLNDGDVLTAEGVAAAVKIGRGMTHRIQIALSSGAQRATQAVGCMVAGHGKAVPGGVVVDPAVRSQHEDRWRALVGQVGSERIDDLRGADRAFVDSEAATLAGGLRDIFTRLGPGQRALVVAHSPTNEAAVFGLTGTVVAPFQRGEGVVIVQADDGTFTVSRAP